MTASPSANHADSPATRLQINLAGHDLVSPIILAAGTAGTLDEMSEVLDLSKIGAVVTKSITKEERKGNPFPRITWTRAGMINAIGLANPGLDGYNTNIAPRVEPTPTRVIGSVAGDSIEDYVQVASAMDQTPGMEIIELNVSCPNVHSGLEFGADPGALKELVTAVNNAMSTSKLFVKLSPITVGTPHTIVDLARIAVDAGASGLTLTNTVPAMGIDVHTRKPIVSNTIGGLSGPAIHNIVVRLVHLTYTQLAKDAGVPIIALGGVTRWEDAAEFILAGANAVGIGAGTFASPRAPLKVTKGLDKWVRAQSVSNIQELVGAVII
jgi:dihydroorotate dehydrogenase (NAD+) catalytic subunit